MRQIMTQPRRQAFQRTECTRTNFLRKIMELNIEGELKKNYFGIVATEYGETKVILNYGNSFR